MADLVEQIQSEATKLLPRRSSILIAVSGGLDSMLLAKILHQLAPANQWIIQVAHFDHDLRGKASIGDRRLVSQFCQKRNIPFHSDIWLQDANRIKEYGLEKAARDARYSFLKETAKNHRCRYIVTAHHADDQAETFLWKLLRGAGGKGLGGMQPLSSLCRRPVIHLARPLLLFSKGDLAQCAQILDIKYREDESNRSTRHLRNRIRLKLMPYLKRHFHPEAQYPILQAQRLIADEADYALQTARAWLAQTAGTPFESLHPAVQRWAIWQQLIDLKIDPQYFQIESLREFACTPFSIDPHRQLSRDLAGKVYVNTQTPKDFQLDQTIITPTSRWQSHSFGDIEVQYRSARKIPNAFIGETFDAAKIPRKIVLRHWRAGDRFRPIGNRSSRKLQDLFTDAKVTAQDKRRRVLACDGDNQPFWVQGLRIGESAKMDAQTTRILLWKWRKV